MKPTRNPNIFDYATSELSQDAFICYMLNFSEPAELFLEKCGIRDEKIIKVWQQYPANIIDDNGKKYKGHIDILVKTDNHYLIIEDKTGSGEHDDQICRYVKSLKEQQAKKKLDTGKNIHVCYLKTHDYLWPYEPPKNNDVGLRAEGPNERINCFSLTRQDILDILNKADEDLIFSQFKAYLNSYQVDPEDTPITKWNRNYWFKFLEPIIKQAKEKQSDLWAGIGYVPNRSGGFYGCWLGGDETSFPGYTLYKQIEIDCSKNGTSEIKLCHKVQTWKPKLETEKRPKIKKETLDAIKEKFKEQKSEFKVTGRCSGWSTTYARIVFSTDSEGGKYKIMEKDIQTRIKEFILAGLF